MTARFENEDNRVAFDGPVRLDDRCAEDEARLHEMDDKAGVKSHETNVEVESNDISRQDTSCYMEIRLEPEGEAIGSILFDDMLKDFEKDSFAWNKIWADIQAPDGVHGVYFVYHGDIKIQLKELIFG